MKVNCFTGACFPAFISFVLVFKASVRKIINFINLINVLFLFPSLALPVTGSYSEHVFYCLCLEVVLCWTSHALYQLVLDAVKVGRERCWLSWVCRLSKSQENANVSQFRLLISHYYSKILLSSFYDGWPSLSCDFSLLLELCLACPIPQRGANVNLANNTCGWCRSSLSGELYHQCRQYWLPLLCGRRWTRNCLLGRLITEKAFLCLHALASVNIYYLS